LNDSSPVERHFIEAIKEVEIIEEESKKGKKNG
jgi:hypothetical protein